jgi:hypothetical protein
MTANASTHSLSITSLKASPGQIRPSPTPTWSWFSIPLGTGSRAAPGAFNGDLLSDTSPDCCRNIYDLRGLSHTSSGPASITIKGKSGGKDVSFTLTPPRNNLNELLFLGRTADADRQAEGYRPKHTAERPPPHPD